MSQLAAVNVARNPLVSAQPFVIPDIIVTPHNGGDAIPVIGQNIAGTKRQVLTPREAEHIFRLSSNAKAQVWNLTMYQHITFTVQLEGVMDREFKCDLSGFIPGVLPTRTYTGGVFFNDVGDISGDYEVESSSEGGVFTLTFIRNGEMLLYFRSELDVTTAIGSAKGSGSWSYITTVS